jgi:hypothetical protein
MFNLLINLKLKIICFLCGFGLQLRKISFTSGIQNAVNEGKLLIKELEMKTLILISFLKSSICNVKKVFKQTLVVLALSSSSPVFANLPFCEHFFSNGIQAHGPDNYVRFNYNAQLLNGSSNQIYTKNLSNNNFSIKKSCGTGPCYANLHSAPDLILGEMLQTDATNVLIIPASKKVIVGANNIVNFDKVVLSERSTATFAPKTIPYVISQLEVGYKSKLQLPAGEYWVSRLRLEVEGRIDVIGEGQVTLYVGDSMWVPFNFKINENTKNPGKMAIYTFSDSNYYSGSKTYAFIRSEGEVILNYRSTIVGGVLGKFINLETDSQIVYDPAAAKALEIKNYCRPVTLPLDVDQPVVIIDQYDDITVQDNITITGTIMDSGDNASGIAQASINISGRWYPIPITGTTFSMNIPLEMGDNWLTFLILDHAGNEVFLSYYVSRVLVLPE